MPVPGAMVDLSPEKKGATMRKPGLKQLYEWAVNPASRLEGLGRRRAVMQCRRHPRGWFTLAEVRGDVILVGGLPEGDLRSSYDIEVACNQCPDDAAVRILDLAKLRVALAAPHESVLKLDIDRMSRTPRGPG